MGSLRRRLSDFKFPGVKNHVRCFDHVVSLSAKSILSLFDVSCDNKADAQLDDAEKALMQLADGLESEEAANWVLGNTGDDEDLVEDDSNDANEDAGRSMGEVTASMSAAELEELRTSALPVRTMLVKVRTCLHITFERLLINTFY